MFKLDLEPVFNNVGYKIPIEQVIDYENFDVNVKGDVSNQSGIVSMNAICSFDYSAPCDRCAKEVKRHFDIPAVHIFVIELNDEDNAEYIVVPDMNIDMDELLHEDIVLNMPTKYLCKEDCKGICPKCKADLNIDSCSCEREIDPRLSILEQLLDK